MADSQSRQEAVDRNYEAFRAMLPDLLRTLPGKFVLLRDGEVVESFDTARDALLYAEKAFDDDLYSIQQVTDQVVDLGYFSHAVRFDTVRP